jgi:hypothetical protein
VNGFASHEVNIKVRVLDAHMLLLRALEAHLDPRLNRIPQHAMTEASGVKVSSQFPIKAMQYVQVERCGDSIIVVVGSQERAVVFHHICTEQ